ncbi:MAG: YfhO family protein [Candidatus Sericytochromatia bacterium]
MTKHFRISFIYLIILGILFSPILFFNNSLYLLDTFKLDMGLITKLFEIIKNGDMPFLMKSFSSGQPISWLYEPILYPFLWLFYFIPFFKAFSIYTVIHYFIAFYGMYLLCKNKELSTESSFIGGIIFSLNGFAFELSGVHSMLAGYSYIPFIFLFLEKALKNISFKNLFFLSIFSILQISVRFDFFYYTLMFLAFYYSLKIIFSKDFRSNLNFKNILNISFVLILSGLVLSVAIIPLQDFLKYTTRGSGDFYAQASVFSLDIKQLLHLIFNNLFGKNSNASESIVIYNLLFNNETKSSALFYNFYIGIISFFFSLYYLIFKKNDPDKKIYLILMFLFVILALGTKTLLFKLFYDYFPLFKILRFPIKFMIFIEFILSLFTALGLDFFIKERDIKKSYIISSLLFIPIIFGYIYLFLNSENILNQINPYIKIERGLNFTFQNINFIYYSLSQSFILFTLFLFIMYIFIKKEALSIYIPILITFELFVFSMNNLVYLDNDFLSQNSEIVNKTEKLQDKNNYRFFITDIEDKIYYSNIDNPQITEIKTGIESMDYSRTLLYKMNMTSGSYFSNFNYVEIFNGMLFSKNISYKSKINLLKIMSVKYYIKIANVKRNINPTEEFFNLLDISDKFPLKIYELKEAEPIFNFKTTSLVEKDDNRILDIISHSSEYKLDLPKKVVIIKDDDNYRKAIDLVKKDKSETILENKIQHLPSSSNEYNLEVTNKESGYLVISNFNYDGWKAYNNGNEIPILKANYAYQALRLPSGKNKINLTYRPPLFDLSLKISIISFILLALYLTFIKIREKQENGIK